MSLVPADIDSLPFPPSLGEKTKFVDRADFGTIAFCCLNPLYLEDGVLSIFNTGTANAYYFLYLWGVLTSDIVNHEMICTFAKRPFELFLNGEKVEDGKAMLIAPKERFAFKADKGKLTTKVGQPAPPIVDLPAPFEPTRGMASKWVRNHKAGAFRPFG